MGARTAFELESAGEVGLATVAVFCASVDVYWVLFTSTNIVERSGTR
jgi:hypothetical protein